MTLHVSRMKELTDILGYRFNKMELLELALTHSSARVASNISFDNERYEFLGDRVLGLAISDLLIKKFPNEDEGDLAKRYNALVRKETCCAVSKQIGIGDYVIMSDSERASGGAEKETILADVCEALLGAIYIDAGFPAAQDFINRFWTSHLENTDQVPADPKSSLQEWAQAHRKELPLYTEVCREGPDHEPTFTTKVSIDGIEPEIGIGSSKRIAEHNAATNMLKREKIWE